MTWFIRGSRGGLVLGVSDSGSPICHGGGHHEPKPPGLNDFGSNIDHALLRRLQQAECGWTLALPTEAEVHIDGNGEGLFNQVQQSPEKSHGMVKFYTDSPDAVTFVMVVPEPTFSHIRRLLELVLLSESLQYVITVDFLGFRVPHARTDTPTWDEFINGKPYFFEELSVSLSTSRSDA